MKYNNIKYGSDGYRLGCKSFFYLWISADTDIRHMTNNNAAINKKHLPVDARCSEMTHNNYS